MNTKTENYNTRKRTEYVAMTTRAASELSAFRTSLYGRSPPAIASDSEDDVEWPADPIPIWWDVSGRVYEHCPGITQYVVDQGSDPELVGMWPYRMQHDGGLGLPATLNLDRYEDRMRVILSQIHKMATPLSMYCNVCGANDGKLERYHVAVHISIDYGHSGGPFLGAPQLIEHKSAYPIMHVCENPDCRQVLKSLLRTYNQNWIYREAQSRGYLDGPFAGLGATQRRPLTSIIASYLIEPWLPWQCLDLIADKCRSLVPRFGRFLFHEIMHFKHEFRALSAEEAGVYKLALMATSHTSPADCFQGWRGIREARPRYDAAFTRARLVADDLCRRLNGPVYKQDEDEMLEMYGKDEQGITQLGASRAHLTAIELSFLFNPELHPRIASV